MRTRELLVTLLVSLISFVPAASGGDSVSARLFEGRRVTSVSFEVDSPLKIPFVELEDLAGIEPGDVMTYEKLRMAIATLTSKGIFKKVEVYGRDDAGGVSLLFRVFPEVLISEITVEGARHFSDEKIISASGLRVGDVATAEELRSAEERIQSLYRRHGYFEIDVEVRGACRLENGAAEIRVAVSEGAPPILESVRISGLEGEEADSALDILGLSEGEVLNFTDVQRRLGKLRAYFQRKGFLAVRVRELAVEKGERGAVLSVKVDKGRKYRISFVGNDKFSAKRLEKVVDVRDGRERTEREVLSRVENRLREFFREEGYPFARVDVNVNEGNEIRVSIMEGERGIINEIVFSGNESVPDEELRKRMETDKWKFYSFLMGGGIFQKEVLSRDLENLRGYYQSQGFPNARIYLKSLEKNEKGGFTIVIGVEEGERYYLREISFEGVTFFTKRELLRQVSNRVGAPVDYVAAYADAYSIQREYLNNGFDDCKVGVKFLLVGRGGINLIYRVDEGKRYRFEKLVVHGNRNVSSRVIIREFPLKKGDFLDESALIDFQRALYRTGLFKRVRLKKVKNEEAGIASVVVEVVEADFFTAEVGIGYGTDTGYRASLGVLHKNLDGTGRSLEGKLSLSEREKKVITSLRQPWLLGIDVEGILSVSYQDVREKSFSFESYSISGSVTREFLDKSLFSIQVEFNDEKKKEVSPGAVLSPEDVSLNRSVVIRPILVLDLRDDSFNPRKGYFYNLNGEFSSGYIGSELDYLKTNGQVSGYFPLSERFVIALSGRGGIIESLTDEEVPIDRRFFLGGRATVRGFDENELGPKGADGSPIGGDTMMVLNAELRCYLPHNFVFGLFMDMGSLWIRGDSRYPFELRETAGFSIKYLTPVGPVSFDMGFKLDRKPDEPLSAWHFTVGLVF